MAWGSRVASALDTRSIVRFGSSGKSACMAAVRPGSSTNTTSGAIGAVSCAAATSVRARARTAEPATAKARPAGTPRLSSAMPRVTGPVSWSLIGVRRPATAPRKARRPTNGSPSMPAVVSGARGSSIGSSSSSEPSGEHLDAVDAPRRLGDHPLHAGAVRQRRRGGQARLALEHEGGRGARVGVRQAPDRGRHPVLKVDDLHRRSCSQATASPWLVTPRMAIRRRAWANLGVPWPSSPDPGRPASRGGCCRCCSVPRSVTRSASTASRWRARPRRWRGRRGRASSWRCVLPDDGEPHRAADRRRRPRSASANWAAITGDARRRRRASAVARRRARASWRRSRRSPATCSSTAPPTATSAASRCACPTALRPRPDPARRRRRGRRPDRRAAAARRRAVGRRRASCSAVGVPARGRRDPSAARAGPALGGARARRPRAARPPRARGGGAVPPRA